MGAYDVSLLVFGSNPAVSAPHVRHVRERLSALDLLVVCDLFVSETAALAAVVLPVTQRAEEDGTMTDLEGRVVRRRALRTRRWASSRLGVATAQPDRPRLGGLVRTVAALLPERAEHLALANGSKLEIRGTWCLSTV